MLFQVKLLDQAVHCLLTQGTLHLAENHAHCIAVVAAPVPCRYS